MNAKKILFLISLLAGVIGLYWGFYFLIEHGGFLTNLTSEQRAVRGQFGDQFGALNTLFAGIGSALLLFTIITQWSQIRDQQRDLERQLKIAEEQGEELRLQRAEMSRAAAANEHQVIIGIAQIKIANLQAMIEIAKLRSITWVPGSAQHTNQIDKIEGVARKMALIIDNVNEKTGNV